MRASLSILALAIVPLTGCAALTGLSSLEECPEGTCGDASVDSHVADQGIDTNVEPDVADAHDTGTSEVAEAGDSGDGGRDADAAEGGDAHDADADTPPDTTDTAPDTFDAAPCTLACDTTHSIGGSCVGGKCVYTSCKSGFGDCDTTGTDVNGCETPITTITDCGGCGNLCDTATSTPTACAGGTCIYTCKANFGDCDSATVDPHDLNGCETPTNTITNCAGCGNKCDSLHSNGATCDGTKCSYSSCKPGFTDCNTGAPNTDGCETSTTTTTDCGGCGKACDTVHSTPTSCTSGTCNYTCMSGFVDCNKASGDLGGCECPGTACCGASSTTCQNAHSDGPSGALGLGQTYYDCAALGTPGTASTYSETMAREASAVSPWAVSPTKTVCSDVVGGSTCIAGTSSNCIIAGRNADPTGPECAIWCYDGVLAGRVFTSTTGCFCPCPGGDAWN